MNELYHFGIKGMKWGIRRYQNPDGTLTAEGKRRYDVDDAPKTYAEKQKLLKKDYKKERRHIVARGIAISAVSKLAINKIGKIAANRVLRTAPADTKIGKAVRIGKLVASGINWGYQAYSMKKLKEDYYSISGNMMEHSDVLAHHGILGMKWGIRRTPEELGHAPKSHEDSLNARAKRANEMSDDELTRSLTRVQREQQYNSLTRTNRELAKEEVKTALAKSGGKIVATVIAGVTAALVARYLTSTIKEGKFMSSTKASFKNGLKAVKRCLGFAADVASATA